MLVIVFLDLFMVFKTRFVGALSIVSMMSLMTNEVLWRTFVLIYIGYSTIYTVVMTCWMAGSGATAKVPAAVGFGVQRQRLSARASRRRR